MLSAQTTDKKVNEVTPALFAVADEPARMAELEVDQIREIIREIGLAPDMILCRSEHPIEQSVRDKIALFCNVRADHVFEGRDVESIYEVPLLLHQQNMGHLVNERLELNKKPNLSKLMSI